MDFLPPVPSIATQYIRSRKQHDATARQWTENCARTNHPRHRLSQLRHPLLLNSPRQRERILTLQPRWTFFLITRRTRTAVRYPLPLHSRPLKAILFPLTRMRKWQDLRMEKAKKRKRIERLPQSAIPIRWSLCWIRRRRREAAS